MNRRYRKSGPWVLIVLNLALGSSASASPNNPVWTPLQPTPRSSASRAAYDSSRHRMLVFGSQTLDDGVVWALSLSAPRTWTPIPAPGGPSARSGAALCYDALNDRLIVFGGSNYDGMFSGTWALRLSGPGAPAWDSLAVAGTAPNPSSVLDVAYDASNARMIVLSGTSTAAFLTLPNAGTPQWTSTAIAGPAPAPVHGYMRNCWDGTKFYVVTDSGDVSQVSFAGPPAWTVLGHTGQAISFSYNTTVTYDAHHGGLLVAAADVVTFSRISLAGPGAPAWSSVPVTDPQPDGGLYGQTFLADPLSDRVVAFGGTYYDPSYFPHYSDSFIWDLSVGTWTSVQPPGGIGGAAVYDSKRRRMLLLRGSGKGSSDSTSVWALALTGSNAWTALHTTGMPASGSTACAVYDEVGDRLVLFNGFNTWELQLAGPGDPHWAILNASGGPPPAHYAPSVTYDPTVPRMLLFGGGSSPNGGSTSDTWQLTLGPSPTWTPLAAASPPPPRMGASAVFDRLRQRLVIFGGGPKLYGTYSGAPLHNDVWALPVAPEAGLTWQRLMHDSVGTPPYGQTPSGFPHERVLAMAAYDFLSDRLIIMAGQVYQAAPEFYGGLSDGWALPLSAPSAWTRLQPTGTAPWEGGAVAGCLDVLGDRMVMFGGSNSSWWQSGATWFLDFGRAPAGVPAKKPRVGAATLEPPSPNPSRAGVRLIFTLSTLGNPVRLEIFDVSGRHVRALLVGPAPQGRQVLDWDGKTAEGRKAPAGIYFARLKSGRSIAIRRLVLLP